MQSTNKQKVNRTGLNWMELSISLCWNILDDTGLEFTLRSIAKQICAVDEISPCLAPDSDQHSCYHVIIAFHFIDRHSILWLWTGQIKFNSFLLAPLLIVWLHETVCTDTIRVRIELAEATFLNARSLYLTPALDCSCSFPSCSLLCDRWDYLAFYRSPDRSDKCSIVAPNVRKWAHKNTHTHTSSGWTNTKDPQSIEYVCLATEKWRYKKKTIPDISFEIITFGNVCARSLLYVPLLAAQCFIPIVVDANGIVALYSTQIEMDCFAIKMHQMNIIFMWLKMRRGSPSECINNTIWSWRSIGISATVSSAYSYYNACAYKMCVSAWI